MKRIIATMLVCTGLLVISCKKEPEVLLNDLRSLSFMNIESDEDSEIIKVTNCNLNGWVNQTNETGFTR